MPANETAPPRARDLVTRRLLKRARRFPDLDLRPLDVTGLDERDAALARAIDQAVTRRWRTLATVVDACLDQQWAALEPAVQAPLLVGAAQLLLLERIPDHAAISEAVQWAKQGPRPRSRGLVNAVLRAVAGLRGATTDAFDPGRRDELPLADGRGLRLDREVFDPDPLVRLGQTTSHADFLLGRWRDQHGEAACVAIARHDLVAPPVVMAGVAAPDDSLRPHEAPGFHVYEGPGGGLPALLARHPEARVQDVASAAPVQATASLNPAVVVDFCAGLGTKTRQLAALHRDASVLATDPDPRRRAELRRVAADTPGVTALEPGALSEHSGRADLLVLDVPCSNSGVLARRPEAKYRVDAGGLESLAALQRQIVADALPLLAPGGTILYATCSIDREENEEQLRWMRRWHRLEPAVARLALPRGAPGDAPATYADGGFFAVLRAGPGS